METFGTIALLLVFYLIIKFFVDAFKMANQPKNSKTSIKKAIDNSTSLERIRQTIRTRDVLQGKLYKTLFGSEEESLIFELSTSHQKITDAFFVLIEKYIVANALGLGNALVAQYNNCSTDVAYLRFFGVAFALTLFKCANLNHVKVKRTKVTEYINSSTLTSIEKYEIAKYTKLTLKFFYSELRDEPLISPELDELTIGLLCGNYEKGNFADPMYKNVLYMALMSCYVDIDFYSTRFFDSVKRLGLLR